MVTGMDALFLVDRHARQHQLNAEERAALRRAHAQVWVEEIHSECRKLRAQLLPKSALGGAVNYTLNMWAKLWSCFEHAEVELSNNVAENSMRPVALGRKNWLHVGSVKSGPKVAAILSVIESCRRLDVPVKDYLLAVLPGMSQRKHSEVISPRLAGPGHRQHKFAHTGSSAECYPEQMCLWNRPREALDTAPTERPDNNTRRPGGISNKAAAISCYMRSQPTSSTSLAPSPRLLLLPSHFPSLTSVKHKTSPPEGFVGRLRSIGWCFGLVLSVGSLLGPSPATAPLGSVKFPLPPSVWLRLTLAQEHLWNTSQIEDRTASSPPAEAYLAPGSPASASCNGRN